MYINKATHVLIIYALHSLQDINCLLDLADIEHKKALSQLHDFNFVIKE